MHARVVLGVGKVSCLERCHSQFRSVLIERERGSTVHKHTHNPTDSQPF